MNNFLKGFLLADVMFAPVLYLILAFLIPSLSPIFFCLAIFAGMFLTQQVRNGKIQYLMNL